MRPRFCQRDDWIAEYGDVRPARRAVDDVQRVTLSRVEVCARTHREVATCREAHDPDSRRIEMPFSRVRSQQPNRALSVTKLDRVVILGTDPVAKDERRDTE